MWNRNAQSLRSVFLLLNFVFLLAGCRHGMEDQPKVLPLQESDFFPDGRSSRMPAPGTVARGHLEADPLLYTGKVNGKDATVFPFPVTRAWLERGRERFDIYCSVCHDRVGTGHGMVVRRGFPHPPSFHSDDLRKAPVGHFFDVMTNGFGRMYPYADRVSAEDRWAIAAYVRALQRSQHISLRDLPEEEKVALENEPVQLSTAAAEGALTAW